MMPGGPPAPLTPPPPPPQHPRGVPKMAELAAALSLLCLEPPPCPNLTVDLWRRVLNSAADSRCAESST